ncbi:uncharacterized protein LOC110432342 [Sorghum bicolor]|uniref:uncharacterized protein LOC110432342 n=1 Tax=Sorghum bicolor TaxID=4558 RepID=UPI000B426784|nr:uncharacterized protein LOC110432342 [Sorghum bicolor]|eukprot:XP_021308233.1 uncharacterized protein LOC110432342 [Sorghum bicolor]
MARQRALHIASPSPRLPQAAARPHPAVTHSRTPAQVATREQPSAAVPEREEEPPPPRSARRQRSRDSVRSRLTCRRSRRPLPSGCPLCLTPKPRPRAPDGGRLTAGRPALKQRRSGQRQRPGHGTRREVYIGIIDRIHQELENRFNEDYLGFNFWVRHCLSGPAPAGIRGKLPCCRHRHRPPELSRRRLTVTLPCPPCCRHAVTPSSAQPLSSPGRAPALHLCCSHPLNLQHLQSLAAPLARLVFLFTPAAHSPSSLCRHIPRPVAQNEHRTQEETCSCDQLIPRWENSIHLQTEQPANFRRTRHRLFAASRTKNENSARSPCNGQLDIAISSYTSDVNFFFPLVIIVFLSFYSLQYMYCSDALNLPLH